MWRHTHRRFCTICFTLACLLFLFSPHGHCAEMVESLETITISKTDWETLKANNDAQKKALLESRQALTETKKALSESNQALAEAKNLLEVSLMTSTEAQEKLTALLNESAQQKKEIELLKCELEMQRQESLTASDALSKANQYLNDTRREIQENEAAWRKRENQLERQRLLWQIGFVLLGGAALLT